MGSYATILILVALFAVLIYSSRRNRQRAATRLEQTLQQMGPGTEVMTTSGLFGTIVAMDQGDDAVLLSIAPGVEVKWALAALKDVAEVRAQAERQAARRSTRDVAPAGTDSHPRGGPGLRNRIAEAEADAARSADDPAPDPAPGEPDNPPHRPDELS